MEQAPKPMEAAKPKSKTLLYVVIVIVLIVAGVSAYILFQPPASNGCTSSSTLTCININDDSICATGAAACNFTSANITISVNTKVTWTNTGGVAHTVYACSTTNNAVSAQCPTMDASGLPSFASPTVATHGGTYSYIFSQAGTYYYYCSIHAWMHAEIIVQ